jgi:hypothetical protein
MMKRTHKFVVTATFNKPVTRAEALYEMRDDGSILGEHYCGAIYDRPAEPEMFRVRSIRLAPSTKR